MFTIIGGGKVGQSRQSWTNEGIDLDWGSKLDILQVFAAKYLEETS